MASPPVSRAAAGGVPTPKAGQTLDRVAASPRVSTARADGVSARRMGVSASANTANGTPVSTGYARPSATVHPCDRARSPSALTRRDLPTPPSPAIRVVLPAPARAASSRADSMASSVCLPMRGSGNS